MPAEGCFGGSGMVGSAAIGVTAEPVAGEDF